MANLVVLTASLIVVVALIVFYAVLPRRGYGYVSRLTCPRCSQTFDYRWIPGGSFTSIRLGTKRYMRCPLCHRWSLFEIWSTRIRNPGDDLDAATGQDTRVGHAVPNALRA